jgi:hypothetical protein
MANTIVLQEPNVDTLIAQGWAGLQLERGVSSTNLASFQVIEQLPYVAGQTSYTYIDTTGAPSDWYRTARYGPSGLGTYTPPWPVKAPSITAGDGTRRSLKAARRMLARKLGSIQVVVTSADGNAQGTTIVSRGLATRLDAQRYRQWWVMPTDGVSAGEVRRVGENALNPANGTLLLEPPYLSQIVQGTQVELHKLLPPDETEGDVLGLRQALNLALAECWVLDRLAVTGTGATTLNLSAFGDWLDPEAVYQLYGPPMSGVPAAPVGGYRVRRDAEVVALDIVGVQSGTSLPVELTRPGDTYMRIDGVWTDQQMGFLHDDDESLFQPAFLTNVALVYCYEALANVLTGPAATRYQALAEERRRQVNYMKYRALPHPPEYYGNGAPRGDDWYGGGSWDQKAHWVA